MPANNSLVLSSLDFDTIKNTFKAYLQSQDRFNDYDFDGSNISVLLDVLAYNTFHNAFYLNMVGNEMFLDTAQLRDSVVSHAKELNYTPRSFKSAQANVDIIVTSTNPLKRSIMIPKGTTFTARFGARNFTFSTGENIVITNFVLNSNNTITFTERNVTLYEGYYVVDNYLYKETNPQRFLITNKNVDVSSIQVNVIEDGGANTVTYRRAQSLFDLDQTSSVFFIQGAENEQYEVIFGDGVTGRKPKNNSTISIEYRICNGELPNGSSAFTPDGTIDGETNIRISTNEAASSGSVSESLDSIKYNAPRHFTTQERAITTEDYENLLKLNFPEINTVTAFGGEDLDPPQFGRVFVAVDLKEVDGIPDIKKQEYYRFLKPRSPVSIEPVFVNPEYTYLNIRSRVRYNINITRLTVDDIKTIVSSAIVNYAQQNLNNFNRVFRYSNVVRAIDDSQISIISNETDVRVIKIFRPNTQTFQNADINFNIPLDTTNSVAAGGYTLTSTQFIYSGQRASFQDDGLGNVRIVSAINEQVITTIGVINYTTGLLQLSNLKIDSYDGNAIKIYAVPKSRDVSTINNVILNIIEEDVDLTIEPVRGS